MDGWTVEEWIRSYIQGKASGHYHVKIEKRVFQGRSDRSVLGGREGKEQRKTLDLAGIRLVTGLF